MFQSERIVIAEVLQVGLAEKEKAFYKHRCLLSAFLAIGYHDILLKENIVFLEVLKNLEYLKTDVFFMSYAPLPILGLDSCPVRAYAIEGLVEFSE